MKKKTTALIILFIIIFFILFIIIWILMLKCPALFMNLRKKRQNWIKEDIGKPFLNEEELEQVKKSLEKVPIKRLGSVLSVIGTATYIHKGKQYKEMAKESNFYMREHFGWVYDKLLEHLEKRLPQVGNQPVKCEYAEEHDIALPGFHRFSGKTWLGRGYNIASLHCDLQELECSWPEGFEFDWSKTYSFTIPISVTLDSGLYIFNKKAIDMKHLLPLCFALRNVPRQKVFYKNGYTYLHHGKFFHLISAFKGRKPNGEIEDRLTMQGHAIFCKTSNSYWVYW